MTWRCALFILGMGMGCQPFEGGNATKKPPMAPPDQSLVLARVGDSTVTQADIERRLEQQGSRGHRIRSKKSSLRSFVEDEVRMTLLEQAAIEHGLDHDPEVRDAARRVMIRKLLETELASENLHTELTEDSLRRYYEKRRNEYQQPEARRFVHIELDPTPGGRELAEELIGPLREADEDRIRFHKTAERYSRHPSGKTSSGEMPFLTHEEVEEEFGRNFADILFGLEPGAFASNPVESTRGWHVLRLLGVRTARELSFEEARPEIEDVLLERRRTKRFEDYLENISNRYPVRLYPERFDSLFEALKEARRSPK